MAKKYSKFIDQDHEVKRFRWPYWLLPLLFLSLLLVLGLFIFITIHSTDRFGCFFHCDQGSQKSFNDGKVPPTVFPMKHEREHENTTEVKDAPAPQSIQQKLNQIRVYGKILFSPKKKTPTSLTNSHLKVKLQDTSIADGSSVDIAETDVDLSLYKKGSTLKYEIKCPMPANIHLDYSMDAVLNIGWTPKGSNWIKRGDFLVQTTHPVHLKKSKKDYEQDIVLEYYS